MKIDTLHGSMEVEVWHIGKHVAADPSGFNWRIINDDVDKVLAALESKTNADFYQNRAHIDFKFSSQNTLAIRASDVAIKGAITFTVLSEAGIHQFIGIMHEAATREAIDYEQLYKGLESKKPQLTLWERLIGNNNPIKRLREQEESLKKNNAQYWNKDK